MNDSCPTCGSDDWVPILYGLPGPAMLAAVHLGVIKLGGCVLSLEGPNRACVQCATRWREAEPAPSPDDIPAPVARARDVMDNLPPDMLERFDLGPACWHCGGIMRRTGACYTCED